MSSLGGRLFFAFLSFNAYPIHLLGYGIIALMGFSEQVAHNTNVINPVMWILINIIIGMCRYWYFLLGLKSVPFWLSVNSFARANFPALWASPLFLLLLWPWEANEFGMLIMPLELFALFTIGVWVMGRSSSASNKLKNYSSA